MASFPGEQNLRSVAVLVTGGLGFIGSHLVRRLVACGARVAIAARDTTNAWRLSDIIRDIERHSVDIRDGRQVATCVAAVRPEVLFHLAACGLDTTRCRASDAAVTNVVGTVNILEAARAHEVRRVVNLGSSSEYGDKAGSVREDAPLTPVDIYGCTKAAATMIAHQMARDEGISLITLRPFGVFGEYEQPHKLFSYTISSALLGHDVNLTPGDQCRDYCYVGNIVDGLLLAAEDRRGDEAIFNIGTGEVHPLRYYIELIFRHLPTDKKPNYGALPYRAQERWSPTPDTGRIEVQLGWKPGISVEDGVIRTVEWFVQNRATWMGRFAREASG